MNGLIESLKIIFLDFYDKTFKKTDFSVHQLILYRIVDSYTDAGKEYYKIQCSCTKAIFDLTLREIIFDLDILHGLHPVQSCFVGMEYAKIMSDANNTMKSLEYKKSSRSSCMIACHYKYSILSQHRSGYLTISCRDTNEEMYMEAVDIALSRELIEEFSSAHAFQIGMITGSKFVNAYKKGCDHLFSKNPSITNHLKLVKK